MRKSIKTITNLFSITLLFLSACSFAEDRPPIIGLVDCCANDEFASVRQNYTRTIYAAGGVPYILPRTTNAVEAARALIAIDALVFCGGEDIDPAYYGEKKNPKCGKINPIRDTWEYVLLDEAMKRNMPIVGTCRGIQIINVYFGGTLWQDLPSEYPTKLLPHGNYLRHWVSLEPGSRVSKLLNGATNAYVNTSHHQAVKKVAPGFKVTARSPDGVIEAIEAETMPIAAVQFHPEQLYYTNGESTYLVFFRKILDWAGAKKENVKKER